MKKIKEIIKIVGDYPAIYIKNTLVSIFFIIFLYFLYKGDIKLYDVFISLCVMMVIGLYKFCLSLSITESRILTLRWFSVIEFDRAMLYIDKYILRKNKWLIKPIYYILYYFPTNWPYLFIVYLGKKWWSIRLFINSNKDLIGKYYFNKDWSKCRSPLYLSKILKWYRKYVLEVVMVALFFPMYFKINLVSLEWDKYFKYRLFGIVYATVMIINNLHLVVWLRTTDLIEKEYKILIVFVLVYIFLYYFKQRVDFKRRIEIGQLKWVIRENEEGRHIPYKSTDVYTLLWTNMLRALEEVSLEKYWDLRHYLIFMCLSYKYIEYIDGQYRGYLTKVLHKRNVLNPINLVKVGRFTDKQETFIKFYEKDLPEEYKKYKNIDIVWIYEKNYRISYFFAQYMFYYIYYFGLRNYSFKLYDYELYKTFYGEKVVEEYFKEEMEETESLCFIFKMWQRWLFVEKKMLEDIEKIAKNEICDIPNKRFNSNKEYNEILELGSFFLSTKNDVLSWLDYNSYFPKHITEHINIIRSDVELYREYYGEDLNKFIEFWTVSPNQWPKDDAIMKLRIEVFMKHDPIVRKLQDKIIEEVEVLFQQAKQTGTIVEQIRILQNKHKEKYFFKVPRERKATEFFYEQKMLKEWEVFDQVRWENFINIDKEKKKL